MDEFSIPIPTTTAPLKRPRDSSGSFGRVGVPLPNPSTRFRSAFGINGTETVKMKGLAILTSCRRAFRPESSNPSQPLFYHRREAARPRRFGGASARWRSIARRRNCTRSPLRSDCSSITKARGRDAGAYPRASPAAPTCPKGDAVKAAGRNASSIANFRSERSLLRQPNIEPALAVKPLGRLAVNATGGDTFLPMVRLHVAQFVAFPPKGHGLTQRPILQRQ